MTDYPRPLSTAALNARFGEFRWRPVDDSAIRILDNWQASVGTRILIPQLAGVPSYGGAFSGWVECHREAAPHFMAAFAAVEEAGHLKDIRFYGGCWVPRRIRGGTQLSRHAHGIAMDINPNENPFGGKQAAKGRVGYMGRIGPIFEAHGFAWGGRWTKRLDSMHVEVCGPLPAASTESHPDALLVIDDKWQKALPLMIREGRTYAYAGALNAALGLPVPPAKEDAMAIVRAGEWLSARGYKVTWHGETLPKKLFAHRISPKKEASQ